MKKNVSEEKEITITKAGEIAFWSKNPIKGMVNIATTNIDKATNWVDPKGASFTNGESIAE